MRYLYEILQSQSGPELTVKKISLPVPAEWVGQRIDKALSLVPEIGSRTRAENLLNEGRVLIRGVIPKSSLRLQEGEIIDVEIPETSQTVEILARPVDFGVMFEDQDIIVINKPSGLVVHPAAGHADDTLVNGLMQRVQDGNSDFSMKFGELRPGIVHRLDKDTSGILVVAKTDFAQAHLVNQFKQRSVHRVYFAAVAGIVSAPTGTIRSFLSRHPVDRKKFASVRDEKKRIIREEQAIDVRGKWAVTHFQTLQKTQKASYLKLKLETGRTHQIRVHLSEQGNPILADPIYGSNTKAEGLSRCALHAAELGFRHPRDNKELFFQANWPDDLLAPLKRLGFTL